MDVLSLQMGWIGGFSIGAPITPGQPPKTGGAGGVRHGWSHATPWKMSEQARQTAIARDAQEVGELASIFMSFIEGSEE